MLSFSSAVHRRRPFVRLFFSLLGAGLLSACGGDPAGGMPPRGPVEVTVTEVQPRNLNLNEELPGRTAAYKVAEIRPQVTGIVASRLFKEGTVVKAGDQLYQIDDAVYGADLERAEADLQRAEAAARVAKSRMERLGGLLKTKAVSQQDYDDAQAAYEQASASIASARAAIRRAEINLQYTRVYAPISGRIGMSQVTEGALVTANQAQPLTRITQLDPIYVDMPQSSVDFIRLRDRLDDRGERPVRLTVDGLDHPYEHSGTLESSEVTVDQSTGAVQLRAVFPNPNHKLLPGLFVKASLSLGEKPVLLVPQRAASRQPDGKLQVWRLNGDNTAAPVIIETDGSYRDQWIVASGLAPGDRIVIEGYQKLSPGTPVVPAPVSASAERPSGESKPTT